MDTSRRVAVYRFYDQAGTLLYVGITATLPARRRQHAKRHWWPDVYREEFQWYPAREEATAEEARAIRDEHPKYNVMGAQPGDTSRVAAALAEFRAAQAETAATLAELHAAIVDEVRAGGRGTQAQLAELTGYSRERIRQITREAGHAA